MKCPALEHASMTLLKQTSQADGGQFFFARHARTKDTKTCHCGTCQDSTSHSAKSKGRPPLERRCLGTSSPASALHASRSGARFPETPKNRRGGPRLKSPAFAQVLSIALKVTAFA